ncbi:MAG: hypothetical protein IAE79_09375 [Anaerolinea sp.]|nr:hypothetical protein [Anaerolinea sp.]
MHDANIISCFQEVGSRLSRNGQMSNLLTFSSPNCYNDSGRGGERQRLSGNPQA